MEESYTEGVATHGGREPCVGAREGAGEASAVVRAGWAIEPRNGVSPGCRRRHDRRKAIPSAALARAVVGPRAVGEPVHVRNLSAREPGDPAFARPADQRAGRSGNAEAVRLG
jgi:hypothetical protein